MVRRVGLVGHCGPDTSYLMMAVKKVAPGAELLRVNDEKSLQNLIDAGDALLLVNRMLDGDFPDADGIELIARLNDRGVKQMLISNYDDAQSAAIRAGALSGFGKRDIGSAKAAEKLRAAVGAEAAAQV